MAAALGGKPLPPPMLTASADDPARDAARRGAPQSDFFSGLFGN